MNVNALIIVELQSPHISRITRKDGYTCDTRDTWRKMRKVKNEIIA